MKLHTNTQHIRDIIAADDPRIPADVLAGFKKAVARKRNPESPVTVEIPSTSFLITMADVQHAYDDRTYNPFA